MQVDLLIRIRWFWEVYGHTFKSCQCDCCNMGTLLWWQRYMFQNVDDTRERSMVQWLSKKCVCKSATLTRYRTNVWSPVPRPTDDNIPKPIQYVHHKNCFLKIHTYWKLEKNYQYKFKYSSASCIKLSGLYYCIILGKPQ